MLRSCRSFQGNGTTRLQPQTQRSKWSLLNSAKERGEALFLYVSERSRICKHHLAQRERSLFFLFDRGFGLALLIAGESGRVCGVPGRGSSEKHDGGTARIAGRVCSLAEITDGSRSLMGRRETEWERLGSIGGQRRS